MSFVDTVLENFGSSRTAKLLDKLDAATPWNTLARPITQLPEYKSHGAGRPPWEPAMKLECLMLLKWFNLPDPGLEEGLKDRIIFRKFVGLFFTDATPDETVFVKFRKRLRESARLGYTHSFVPDMGSSKLPKIKGMELIPIRNVSQAIERLM